MLNLKEYQMPNYSKPTPLQVTKSKSSSINPASLATEDGIEGDEEGGGNAASGFMKLLPLAMKFFV